MFSTSGKVPDLASGLYSPRLLWTDSSVGAGHRLHLSKTVVNASGDPSLYYSLPVEEKDVPTLLAALNSVFPQQMDDVVRAYRFTGGN